MKNRELIKLLQGMDREMEVLIRIEPGDYGHCEPTHLEKLTNPTDGTPEGTYLVIRTTP